MKINENWKMNKKTLAWKIPVEKVSKWKMDGKNPGLENTLDLSSIFRTLDW